MARDPLHGVQDAYDVIVIGSGLGGLTAANYLGKLGRSIDHVVSLEVPLEDIVDRVTGRRVCLHCGQTYHVRYSPPPENGVCVSCGEAKIVQRGDDTEEVVRKRWDEYKAKTGPVLPYYEEKGLVREIPGVGSLEEITERIKKAIGVQ